MTIGTAPTSPLSYDEATTIAFSLVGRWQGITGQSAAPSIEQVTDLVQRVLRDTAVLLCERTLGGEAE